MSDSTSAITDVTSALEVYTSCLDWDTDPEKARLALSALRFLLINRPQASSISGVNLSFADIATEKAKIETYLQAQKRISFTRARRYQ